MLKKIRKNFLMIDKEFSEVKKISFIFIGFILLNIISILIVATILICIFKNQYSFLLIAPIAVSLNLIFNWIKIINNPKVFNYDLNIIKKLIIFIFLSKVAIQFEINLLILGVGCIFLSCYLIFFLNYVTIGTITLLPACFLPGLYLYIGERFKVFSN